MSRVMLDPADTNPDAIEAPGGWEPCGHCWGQREILTPDPHAARGYTPGPCPWCCGVGEVRWTT